MSGSTREGISVELYVRSLAPRGVRSTQEGIVDRLRDLRESETVSEFSVCVCGSRVPASRAEVETDVGATLLERIGAFERWAERTGCSLGPLFERSTVHSSITDETHETIDLPAMVLAEYEGNRLRFVSPCVVDGTLLTVPERLDALADTVSTAEPDSELIDHASTDEPDSEPSESVQKIDPDRGSGRRRLEQ